MGNRPGFLAAALLALAATALAAPPSTEELLPYVPENAQSVVAVDVASLRGHPWVQDWLIEHQSAWSGVDDDAKRFLAEAGLDPLRDVDAMVFAAVPDPGPGHGVALFAGRYDTASLGAALAKRGGQALTVAGVSAFLFTSEAGHAALIALASPELVIAGDEQTVRPVLVARRCSSSLAQREVAAGHVDARAPFWMVVSIPEKMRQHAAHVVEARQNEEAEAMRGVMQASRAVQRVAMQANLSDRLELKAWALADTAESAELLRDAAKGALAAMRLQAQDRMPELVDVLRDVEVRVKAAEVTINGTVPLSLLEKLAKSHEPGQAGAQRQAP